MEEIIGFEIKKLSNLIKRQFASHILEQSSLSGVSRAQGAVVQFILSKNGEAVFQKDVELALSIRASSATELLNLMEQNGLIKKLACKTDARKKQIQLTEKALRLQQEIKQKIMQIENKMLNGITAEEKQNFMNTLQKMENNLKE